MSKSVEGDSEASLERTSSHFEKRGSYYKYSRTENDANMIKLIESLPADPSDITTADVLQFYNSMRGHYIITSAVIKHAKFNFLREITDAHLLQFNTKELQDILIAMLPSKAMMNDKLGRLIIDTLLKRAQHLPFSSILFVDFILHKHYSSEEMNKDCSILRLTLQRLFLSKIEDELNYPSEFEEFMKIVAFCNNNTEVLTSKIANLITTSLLLCDDEKFTVHAIVSCMNMLASCGKLNDHVRKLLVKMIELWIQSEVTANEVRQLLRVLSTQRNTIDKEQFNDPKFIRHCVNVVTSETDDRFLFSVQNGFNRLVSYEKIVFCLIEN